MLSLTGYFKITYQKFSYMDTTGEKPGLFNHSLCPFRTESLREQINHGAGISNYGDGNPDNERRGYDNIPLDCFLPEGGVVFEYEKTGLSPRITTEDLDLIYPEEKELDTKVKERIVKYGEQLEEEREQEAKKKMQGVAVIDKVKKKIKKKVKKEIKKKVKKEKEYNVWADMVGGGLFKEYK